MLTVGDRIKEKRLELGMSQDELAKKCGYKSRSSINKIEHARDLPLRKVTKMATALGVSKTYLLGWDENTAYIRDALESVEQKYGPLTEDEAELLIAYRTADESMKARIINIVKDLAE